MKFLADENFPKPLTNKIKKAGHSVKTVQQKALRGSSDEIVSSLGLKEKLIILTFDKDFLKNVNLRNIVVVFNFPRVPTTEIEPLIEDFLREIKMITKEGIFKFSKKGLEKI